MMTKKELAEIRRTLTQDHHAITTVRGCYVNATGEIITRFSPSFATDTEEEVEKYLSVFRRTLSGTAEKNLHNIPFSSAQVLEGAEHQLLHTLTSSELTDEEAVDAFFEKVTGAYHSDDNYVILLACNKYDVPYRARDGAKIEENADRVYTYIVCSICPVKAAKPTLTYDPDTKSFKNASGSGTISAPQLGFLYPTFDDRQTNIYNTLFYTRDCAQAYPDFTDVMFKSSIAMPAAEQEQTFRTVLAEALNEDCSFTVAKAIHTQICDAMEEHKESKEEEPLSISAYQVQAVLAQCGVSEQKQEAFQNTYNDNFGKGAELPPQNIVNPKLFEVRTPDVVIKVATGHSDLLETKVIDGSKYILVRADDGVEVNGLNVRIEET